MSLDTSTNSSSFYNKIYKSRLNILELLSSKNYNVEDYHGFSTSELHSMINNKQLDMLLENKDEKISKIYVKYFAILFKTIKLNHIQSMVDDLYEVENILTKNDILFIITNDDPNDTIVGEVKKIWEESGINIIIYSLKRLQFNILNHEMVPKHTKMTDDEIAEFKKRYNITDNSMIPEISRFDPVAMAVGLRPGEICRIDRPSITSITGVYYRHCINN